MLKKYQHNLLSITGRVELELRNPLRNESVPKCKVSETLILSILKSNCGVSYLVLLYYVAANTSKQKLIVKMLYIFNNKKV